MVVNVFGEVLHLDMAVSILCVIFVEAALSVVYILIDD